MVACFCTSFFVVFCLFNFVLCLVFEKDIIPVPLKEKLFLIEYKGNSISWKPHGEFEKGDSQRGWVKLYGTVRRGFKGVKLTETPIFYKGNNVNKNTGDAVDKIKNKNLNQETIEMFWNVLKQDKTMTAIYFTVGKERLNEQTPPDKENSKYHILVRFESHTMKWYPSAQQSLQWDSEYEKLKQDTCDHFNLGNENNKSNLVMHLVIERGDENDEDSKDETMEIDGSIDIEGAWSEMIDKEERSFIECIVTATHMARGQDPSTIDKMTDNYANSNDGENKEDVVPMPQEMIDKYNNKILNFDFNGPNNAEKEMSLLLENIIFRKIYLSDDKRNEAIIEPMLQLIDRLSESLHKEGVSEASMVVAKVDECRKSISMSVNCNWSTIYRAMKEAMNRLRPFNIEEMLTLYEKTEKAAKEIENEDAVLILGHTGSGKYCILSVLFVCLFLLFFFVFLLFYRKTKLSDLFLVFFFFFGKSTTIHYLAGSTMTQDKVTRHIYPINVNNPALTNVKTEYKITESVTRYIAGVPISLKKSGLKMYGSNKKDRIILCDTPGFDDSSGAEVDVANGLGIIRAVKTAKSVKIVLVIGKADLDMRMHGLKHLCYTLSRILTNYTDKVSLVDIIVTKIGGRDVQGYMKRTFEKALEEMEEKSEDDDDVVVEMFQHVIKLCEKKRIVVLDPLAPEKRNDVLNTLFGDKDRWIDIAATEFQSFVSASSKARIVEQIDKIKDSIVSAPKNYDLVYEKLTMVKKLNSILPINGIVDRVNDCVNKVVKFWNQRCNEAIDNLKQSVSQGSLKQCERDLIKYNEVMEAVNKHQELYEKHLAPYCRWMRDNMQKKNNNSEDGLLMMMEVVSRQHMEMVLEKAFSGVLSRCHIIPIENSTVKVGKIDTSMVRAQMILKHFSKYTEFEVEYNDKISKMKQEINTMVSNGVTHIDSNKFEECFEILINLSKAEERHYPGGDPCEIRLRIGQIEEYLNNYLMNLHTNLSEMFGKFKIQPKSDDTMKKGKGYFTTLESSCGICKKMKLQLGIRFADLAHELDKIYQDTLELMITHAVDISNHTCSFLWGRGSSRGSFGNNEMDDKQKMQEIKSFVEYFTKLREMSSKIQERTGDSYHQMIQQIVGYLTNIERRFENILDTMNSSSDDEISKGTINYGDLVKCLIVLNESTWVFKYRNGDRNLNETSESADNRNLNAILKSAETKLEEYMNILYASIPNDISVSKPQSLNVVEKIVKELNNMRNLKKLSDTLDKESQKIISTIERDIRKQLKRINVHFGMNDDGSGNMESSANKGKIEKRKDKHVKKEFDSRLDKAFASNSLAFVNKCASILWRKMDDDEKGIKDNLLKTEQHLQTDLKAYGEYRRAQMRSCFELVTKGSVDADLDSTAYSLSDNLYEFRDLNNGYEDLMKCVCVDDLLSTWKKKLMDTHKELEQKLSNLRKIQAVTLHSEASRARALSKVDWFLERPAFNSLYMKCEESIQTDTGFTSILECTKTKNINFGEINKQLTRMKEMKDISNKSNDVVLNKLYTDAQSLVGRKITDLFYNGKTMVIRLKSEFDKKELLTELRNVLQQQEESKLCDCHLTPSDKKIAKKLREETDDLLHKCEENATNLVIAWLQLEDFANAEAKIEAIETMRLLLDVKKNVLKDNGDEKGMDNNDIDKKVLDTLNNIKTRFSKIELVDKQFNPYGAHSPKKLYLSLEPVFPKRSGKYQQAWIDIERGIRRKFEEVLKGAQNVGDTDQKRIIRVCSSAIECMPEHLKPDLREQLKCTQADIKQIKNENEDLMKELTQSEDCFQMVSLFFSKLSERRVTIARNIKELILNSLRSHESETKNKLDELSSDVLDNLQSVNQIWIHFRQSKKEYNKCKNGCDDELRESLESEVRQLTQKIEKTSEVCFDFVSDKCDRILKQEMPRNEQDCDYLKEFEEDMAFVVDLISRAFVYSVCEEKFENIMRRVVVKFNEFSIQQENIFHDAFEIGDIDEIVQILDFLKLFSVEGTAYLRKLSKLIDDTANKREMKKDSKNEKSEKKKRGLHLTIFTQKYVISCINMDIMNLKKEITKQGLINGETEKFDAARQNYFSQNLKPKFDKLQKFYQNEMLMKHKITNVWIDCQNYYQEDICRWMEQLKPLTCNKMLFEQKSLEKINLFVSCFNTFKATVLKLFDDDLAIKIDNNVTNACINKVHHEFTRIAQETRDLSQISKKNKGKKLGEEEKEKNRIEMAKCLIRLVKGAETLQFLKDELNSMIDELLKCYAENDALEIGPLSLALEKIDCVWGSILVCHKEIFKGQLILRFNQNANKQNIDTVLKGMDKSIHEIKDPLSQHWEIKCEFNKELIQTYFKKFHDIYDNLIKKHLRLPLELEGMVRTLITGLCAKATQAIKRSLILNQETKSYQFSNVKYWDSNLKTMIVKIMANVFAIWTLNNSKYYFEAPSNLDKNVRKMYLFKPKAAQIVALLRLLCIDDGTTLARNFVEIGTGEGKSVTLAVASCVLALIGFKVNCVCYSKYLSRRDYDSFSKLFRLLDVSDYVEYGTISDMCDKQIIDEINIRQETVNMVTNNAQWKAKTEAKEKEKCEQMENVRPTVLLVDEVDVLFGGSFFGAVLGLNASVSTPAITRITDLIWNQFRKDTANLSFENVKQSREYGALKRAFGNNEAQMQFFDCQIEKMIIDVEKYKKNEYIVRDDRICYKHFDSYESCWVYPHQTMFSYYYEHENGNIKNIDAQKTIDFTCCEFSYVELVKRFNIMIGVTGTLKDVIRSQIQKKAIKEIFNVSKYTFMPTLYHTKHNNMHMKCSKIVLCENSDFHAKLKEEITTRLTDNEKSQPRCVFVFFKNIKDLNEFDNCNEFSIWKNDRILLIAELTNDEKKLAVTRSCMSESILLSTKSFGRGTDFQVKDEIVALHGGPHVIQTFFSDDRSEETQIKGRTARQGGEGSYSMVLKREDLMQQLNIEQDEMKKVERDTQTLYTLLSDKRNKNFEESFGELVKKAKNPPPKHQSSLRLIDALKEGDEQKAMKNLISICGMN